MYCDSLKSTSLITLLNVCDSGHDFGEWQPQELRQTPHNPSAAFGGDVLRKHLNGDVADNGVTQLPFPSHNATMVRPSEDACQIQFNIDHRPTNAYPEMPSYQQLSTDASTIKFDQPYDYGTASTVTASRVLPFANAGSPRPTFPTLDWFDPPEHHKSHNHSVHPCGPGVAPAEFDFTSSAGPRSDRHMTQQQGPLNLNLNAAYDNIDDVKPAFTNDDQISQSMSATRTGYSGIFRFLT
jgi:hypothetical protein